MFNVNFDYLVWLYFAKILRNNRLIEFALLIVSQLKVVYNQFTAYRTQKLYLVNFTGQTMYLEKILQDTFSIPGLYITDGDLMQPLFLSNKEEGNYPLYLHNQGEVYDDVLIFNVTEQTENERFIVWIPVANYLLLTPEQLSKMDKLINYYKLIEKKYTIKTY
jgi:hypothetical protein